jgi:cell shape-determining protein MreC
MEKKTFIYGVGPFRLPWTTFIMETMRARSLYLKNTVRKFPKKSKEKFHKESKEKPYQNQNNNKNSKLWVLVPF